MIFKGFRFGLLLQLAVGPMCLLVFSTSAEQGFLSGLMLAAAVTLVDMLYIALSGAGVAAVMNKKRVRSAVKLFGAAVLVLFGINMIAGSLGVTLIPSADVQQGNGGSIFVKGLLLTASNPLTIVFWSGVFSSRAAEFGGKKRELFFFGAGCVLSTITFLTGVALVGSFASSFLPQTVISILNAAVGAAVIFFGIKMLFKRESDTENKPIK